MSSKQKNAEILNCLSYRAARLGRLIRHDVPTILVRNEALLILAAALELDEQAGAKTTLADWISRKPDFAPDGGALVDLRNDTLDEAIEALQAFLDETDPSFNELINDLSEKVAELKTSPACAELNAGYGLEQRVEPLVCYAIIFDAQDESNETQAFLKVATARGFSVKIDEKTVRVRAEADRGDELETLRRTCFEQVTG